VSTHPLKTVFLDYDTVADGDLDLTGCAMQRAI